MASYRPIPGKDRTFQIRVYRGRDAQGVQLKPYTTTYTVPETFKTQKTIIREVERFASVFESECKAGLVSTEHKTFAEYADYVMQLKERDKKHRTVCRYRELLERITPEIGFLKLADITGEHLNRFYMKLSEPGQNKKTGGGLSPKTIIEHHRLIHTIYTQAIKEGLVRYNVAETATPPANPKKEAAYFEIDEVMKIMEAVDKEPLKWRVMTHLLIATGARRGEIMALKWANVDFTKNLVRIAENLLYSPDRGIYSDTTKTGETRYVSVAPEVMNLLAQHKREQAGRRLMLGAAWQDTGYCFTQSNGKPMHPDSLTDWHNKFSKKYDLPHIYPHKFRHTQASILYGEGIDPVTISKRLGHKQVSTTQNIYAHLLAKADAEANESVANVLYHPKKQDHDSKSHDQ